MDKKKKIVKGQSDSDSSSDEDTRKESKKPSKPIDKEPGEF